MLRIKIQEVAIVDLKSFVMHRDRHLNHKDYWVGMLRLLIASISFYGV